MQHAVHRQTTLIIDVQFKGNSACLVLLPVGDENVIALFTIFSQVHFHYVSTTCHMLCDPDNYRAWQFKYQNLYFHNESFEIPQFCRIWRLNCERKYNFRARSSFCGGSLFMDFPVVSRFRWWRHIYDSFSCN